MHNIYRPIIYVLHIRQRMQRMLFVQRISWNNGLVIIIFQGRKPKTTRCRFLSELYSLKAFRPTLSVIVRQRIRTGHCRSVGYCVGTIENYSEIWLLCRIAQRFDRVWRMNALQFKFSKKAKNRTKHKNWMQINNLQRNFHISKLWTKKLWINDIIIILHRIWRLHGFVMFVNIFAGNNKFWNR